MNKLLIDAALKTEHILPEPAPFVFQTSLNHNYVSYEINGWTHNTEQLSKIHSSLHATILDEFRLNKVELLSPAYRASRDGYASTIPQVTESEK